MPAAAAAGASLVPGHTDAVDGRRENGMRVEHEGIAWEVKDDGWMDGWGGTWKLFGNMLMPPSLH